MIEPIVIIIEGTTDPVIIETGTNVVATEAEALAGVNNVKMMTPLRVKQQVDAAAGAVTSVNGQTGAVTVQPTLVSGTNLKTVNGETLLGSGNLVIAGGAVDSVNGQTGVVVIGPSEISGFDAAAVAALSADLADKLDVDGGNAADPVVLHFLNIASTGATLTGGGLNLSAASDGLQFGTSVTLKPAGANGFIVYEGSTPHLAFNGTVFVFGSAAPQSTTAASSANDLMRKGEVDTALAGKADSSHNHAATDINSGTLDAARLPAPGTTTLGGVKRNTGSAGQFVTGIDTDGSLLRDTPAGAGTVTSVAVSGSDGLEVDSGSPITGSGTIALGVNAAALRSHLNVADGANNYSHPNHSGDVTSTGDGATAIANGVVTNAKLADVATATFKGRTTAGTGVPEDLTAAQARTLLNVADGATANTGTVTSVAATVPTGLTISGSPITGSGTLAIGLDTDRVIPTQTTLDGKVDEGAVTTSGLTMATARLLGRTTASTGAVEEITVGSGLSLTGGELSATGGSATGSYLTSTSSILLEYPAQKAFTISGGDINAPEFAVGRMVQARVQSGTYAGHWVSGRVSANNGSTTLTVEQLHGNNASSGSNTGADWRIYSLGRNVPFGLAFGDTTTLITTGTAKQKFRVPFKCIVVAAFADLHNEAAAGSVAIFDVGVGSTSIFGTNKLEVDTGESTSRTAANAVSVKDDAADSPTILEPANEMQVDIDQAGTGGKGPVLYLTLGPLETT